jgi:uncharacterized membrane protein (DUF2068 family)
MNPPVTARAIRLVAFFEAIKGAAVLLAATGVLALIHQDLGAMAASLVQHTHLNPASKYPRIFLDAVANLQHTRLVWLALGAAAYSTVRFVEAYGLFRRRPWAEWLAALSGGVYIPFEVAGVIHERTVLSAVLLIANVAVVAVMVRALIARR